MFVTALKHLISRLHIPPSHILYKNLELKNCSAVLLKKKKHKKNGEQRHQYLIIGRDKSYSGKSHSKSNYKYKQDEII